MARGGVDDCDGGWTDWLSARGRVHRLQGAAGVRGRIRRARAHRSHLAPDDPLRAHDHARRDGDRDRDHDGGLRPAPPDADARDRNPGEDSGSSRRPVYNPLHGSSPDTHPVADLRHRRDGLCVRHLRTADVAADRRAGAAGVGERAARHAGLQLLGRRAPLGSGDCRRHLRTARRIPHRPARSAARADVEHSALRRLRVRRRLQHEHLAVPVLPLHDVHRRVRRVRGRRRVAGRTLQRPETARARARLHAGVLVGRRRDGHGGLCLDFRRITRRCRRFTAARRKATRGGTR